MTNDYYESTKKQIRDIRRRIAELRSQISGNSPRRSTTRKDGKVEESPRRPADVPVSPSEALKAKLLSKGK